MSKKSKNVSRIDYNETTEIKNKLEKLAKDEGSNISVLIRKATRQFLNAVQK